MPTRRNVIAATVALAAGRAELAGYAADKGGCRLSPSEFHRILQMAIKSWCGGECK